MRLYDFPVSSAAYRVRIGLHLKGFQFESVPVDLASGEHRGDAYGQVNPQHAVPTLVHDGRTFTQSLAILEYLDELRPAPPFLPDSPEGRARVRALALLVCCDIHPLNNARVLKYLREELQTSKEWGAAWYRHWVAEGFGALEAHLQSKATAAFCHGDAPTLADVCLVPQVFKARSMDLDLAAYPTVTRIAATCEALPAFARARPPS